MSPPAVALAATTQEIPLARSPAFEGLNELRQSVARLAGGGYAVAWEAGVFPTRQVFVQFVRSDGSVVFPENGVAVGSPEFDESSPVVVAHPRNGVFVGFVQRAPAESGGGRVMAAWVDAQGARRWPDGASAAIEPVGTLDWHSEPRLAVAPGRGVYVCFMANRFDDADSKVTCQRFAARGERLWSDAGRAAGGGPGWQVLPQMVAAENGGLLVFWRNQGHLFDEDVEAMRIEGQHFAPDGSRRWGTGRTVHTTRVAETNSHSYSVLDAVSDGVGGAVLTFDDWSGNGEPSWDVLAQRVSGAGLKRWGERGKIVLAGAREQHPSALVAAPDGGAFVATWEIVESTRTRARLHRLGADGRSLWKQGLTLEGPESRANDFGAYGSFDGGRLRMAWTHQRQPATFTFDVHLAIFDLAGNRLSDPAGVVLSSAPNGQYLRGFVFDAQLGQGLAVWDDRRRGPVEEMDVYGALYREK
jgi:hypothetical protein